MPPTTPVVNVPDQNDSPSVDLNAILGLMPTAWQKNLPVYIQGGGMIIGVLSFGYQNMVATYPDFMNSIPGAPGYLALAAAGIIFTGSVMHRNVAKQATDAAKVAAMAPPSRKDGSMDATHTFSVGVQQGASSGDPAEIKMAADVMSVLLKHKGGDQ